MSARCFMSECLLPVASYCECLPEGTFCCSQHTTDHQYTPGVHSFLAPPILLSPEEHSTTLLSTESSISHLSQLRSTIISHTTSLIKTVSSLSSSLLSKINDLEVSLITFRKVLLSKKPIEVSQFESNTQMRFPDIQLLPMLQNITKTIENFFNFPIYHIEDYYDCNEILFPKNNDFGFWKIDFKELRTTTVQEAPRLAYQAQVCKSGKNAYFLQGGVNRNVWIGDAYLFDIQKGSSVKLPSGKPKSCAGIACKEGKIHIFGGCNVGSLKSSQTFDLVSHTWTDIPDLPITITACTASAIQNCILVSGFESDKVFAYTPDQYAPAFNVQGNSFKIVCSGWVVTNSVLFENTSENIRDWRSHNINCPLTELWVYNTFRKERFIYFIKTDNALWRVDTEEKKVEVIATNRFN